MSLTGEMNEELPLDGHVNARLSPGLLDWSYFNPRCGGSYSRGVMTAQPTDPSLHVLALTGVCQPLRQERGERKDVRESVSPRRLLPCDRRLNESLSRTTPCPPLKSLIVV